jgi:hypothetical protein
MPHALIVLLWIVGILVGAIALLVLVTFVLGAISSARGLPRGVSISVEAPSTASVDDAFIIGVQIRNDGAESTVVKSIDIGSRYLKGIVIEGFDPAPAETDNGMGSFTATYRREVSASTEFRVSVRCRAVHAGDFAADLDVWFSLLGGRFGSFPIRTVVREAASVRS